MGLVVIIERNKIDNFNVSTKLRKSDYKMAYSIFKVPKAAARSSRVYI